MREVVVKVGLKYGSNYELTDVVDYYVKSKNPVEKDLILEAVGNSNSVAR